MAKSYTRIVKLFIMSLLVLISCNPARNKFEGVATETATKTPRPTSMPYWDLLPLTNDPNGGWISYRMEAEGIAFQYPAVYEDGKCGALFTEYKDTEYYQGLLIGFDGSTIRIHILDEWQSEVYETVKDSHPPSDLDLVTQLEPFSIDGKPAIRYIAKIPNSETLDYSKTAMAYYRDKIYVFSYANLSYLSSCEAPPLTEEQVYEYMLATFEYLE